MMGGGMAGGVDGWVVVLLMALSMVVGYVGGQLWPRGGTRASGAVPSLEAARQTLAQRLARGEIDEDEYLRRSSALEP